MKRIQLFEFEDLKYFPNSLRTGMTNLLATLTKILGIDQILESLVLKALSKTKSSTIVDLGSGAGGVMPHVLNLLHKNEQYKNLKLTLTDLYPNQDATKKYNNTSHSSISYCKDSVDATYFDQVPEGLKTMINCFHHMKPSDAKKILESAQRNKEPLLIYEMGENKFPLLVWVLLLPLSLSLLFIMALFLTPFVRPLTWRQVLFTYVLPVIPLCFAWDGQASLPRMYTFDDLDEMLKSIKTKDYTWEMGYGKNKKNKKFGTYLLGAPVMKQS